MRLNRTRRAWLALGPAVVFLVAACSGAVAGLDGGQAVTDTPVPRATEPAAEPTAPTPEESEEAEPAATVADLPAVAEESISNEDDRPAQLKSATAAWNTNWEKHIIEYDELLSGGPPRDDIPSIDEPQSVSPGRQTSGWPATSR